MAIERPVGSGKKEKVSLDSAAKHILEECRMVLPGIQALFGFQLIAVFNERFDGKLSGPQQDLHFAAIALVTLAVAIVMAPAAALAGFALLWGWLPRRERRLRNE